MKPIQITEKFRPFSTQPGVSIPFPLLQLVFVIYPSKIKIVDHRAQQKVLMSLKLRFKTSCEKFAAFYDLLKHQIIVQCHLEEGFVQYTLAYDDKLKHFSMKLDRYFEEHLSFEVKRPGKTTIIRRRMTKKKPLVLFNDLDVEPPKGLEVLFLGCHKKQDIHRIFARKDIKEYLPIWFLWGQYSPKPSSKAHKEGNRVFLSHLEETLQRKEHHKITPYLNKIFSSSFSPMMIPYLEDFQHWGFYLPRLTSSRISPWIILSELYILVRQFFIHSKGQDIYILPHLPPELVSGKLVKLREGNLTLHLEWSKKQIRRMIIFASKNTQVLLHFQNSVKRFRVRNSSRGSGHIHENNTEFEFKKNKRYFFDRFEK